MVSQFVFCCPVDMCFIALQAFLQFVVLKHSSIIPYHVAQCPLRFSARGSLRFCPHRSARESNLDHCYSR